jgi:hypothetical protein
MYKWNSLTVCALKENPTTATIMHITVDGVEADTKKEAYGKIKDIIEEDHPDYKMPSYSGGFCNITRGARV